MKQMVTSEKNVHNVLQSTRSLDFYLWVALLFQNIRPLLYLSYAFFLNLRRFEKST